MKRYSKNQLEQKAKAKFKEYTNANKLYATSNGQFFLESNRADLHAAGKKLSVIEIDRLTACKDDKGKDNGEKQVIGIKKLTPIVKGMTDKQALIRMLDQEKALKDPRKTAIKLMEDRIAELDVKALSALQEKEQTIEQRTTILNKE